MDECTRARPGWAWEASTDGCMKLALGHVNLALGTLGLDLCSRSSFLHEEPPVCIISKSISIHPFSFTWSLPNPRPAFVPPPPCWRLDYYSTLRLHLHLPSHDPTPSYPECLWSTRHLSARSTTHLLAHLHHFTYILRHVPHTTGPVRRR